MSKYEANKQSGIDWIGNIPEHWTRKRLKDYAEIIMGQSPDSNSYNDEEIGVPFYQGKVDFGEFNPIPRIWCNQPTKISEAEDILISVRAPVGELNITNEKCCIGRGLTAVRIKKGVKKFAYYQFQIINEELKINVTGSTFEAVSSNDVSVLKYIFPPTDEQLTIANYLDHQTQKIDRLIANKKAQAEILKELRQIEINNAVTKGLNPNVELKDSGIDWLGKVPKHWAVKRLKNVSNFIQTGITPPSEKSEYYDGDIPWYGPSGFNGDTILSNPAKYITQKAIEDNEAKLFPIDCIFMIGIGATIGKVGIIKEPSSCNQQLNIVNFKSYVSPDFGVYLLKIYENIIIKIANFSTLPIYNQVQTGNLKFLLPPKEEQLQIAKYLQKRTAEIDKLIINIDAQIEKLQELRKIKIYEAVTGKIKVNAYVEATA